jgi:hypothetical protein
MLRFGADIMKKEGFVEEAIPSGKVRPNSTTLVTEFLSRHGGIRPGEPAYKKALSEGRAFL